MQRRHQRLGVTFISTNDGHEVFVLLPPSTRPWRFAARDHSACWPCSRRLARDARTLVLLEALTMKGAAAVTARLERP